MADYLVHYNKNHSKANGQFVSGDGDGDGQVNDSQYNKDGHKKGVYSAKIDNYKKGNAFRDPYYIDKQGKAHKPFCLPQKYPSFYDHCLKSFNVPDLGKQKMNFTAEEVGKLF